MLKFGMRSVGVGRSSRRDGEASPGLADYSTTLLAETGLVGLWSLQEANASSAATPVDSKNANNLTIFRWGSGVFAGRRSLLKWDATKKSYLFSHKASGNCYNGPTGSPMDKTGATAFSGMAIVAPNVTRSGAVARYTIFAKRAQTANAPGYEFGLVWDGTKTVLYLLIASTDTDALEVRTTADMGNVLAAHVAFSYDGSKTAAGIIFYVNGSPVAMTTVLAALTGSSTNAVAFNIGSRGGNIQFLSAWISHVAFFSIALSAARMLALGYPARKLSPTVTGTTQRKILFIDDNDSDFDGVNSLALLFGAIRAGEAKCIGYVGSTSNLYSVAAVEAMFTYQGLTVPLGQYQGVDHDGTSIWTQGVRDAFNPAKTQTSYGDATTVLRTILAAQDNASMVLVDAGPLHVMQALLQSPADSISALTGAQLVAAKCLGIWNMGGYASNVSAEYNFNAAKASANYVFANNPVPIYNVSYEMAASVNCGIGGNGDNEPCRKAFELYKGGAYGRSSVYDMLAMYAAIYPNNANISLAVTSGTNSVSASTGVNTWSGTAGTHNRYQVATTAAAILVAMENIANDAF